MGRIARGSARGGTIVSSRTSWPSSSGTRIINKSGLLHNIKTAIEKIDDTVCVLWEHLGSLMKALSEIMQR